MNIGRQIGIRSIHNSEKISKYLRVNLLSEQHVCYEVSNLGEFDMILGMNGLRKINAILNTKTFELTYTKKSHPTIDSVNFIMNEEIESDYKNVIDRLMKKNNANESLPFNTKVTAAIRTVDKNPVWTKSYPYPRTAHNFVNSEIEKLLKNNIIQPSFSPYNSPLWVVPKKGQNEDGTPKQRLVIDYKKLNEKTIFDRYPMADVSIILSNLGNSRYFSSIDLESSFYQIKIKNSDKEKTAFGINGAKYEFNRMPFGLKNAPSIFQRAIDDVLRPYIGKFAYVYMDDVVIFSKTKEEHLEHLKIIINALFAANMKISDEKCKFFMQRIEFLGHVISNGRIRVDEKKVETIEAYPIPKTLRQLRSFLGLAGYYRKFIKNYAAIAKPLSLYLRGENGQISSKKSAKIEIFLDQAAVDSFNLIKEKLKENIELFQPDYSKPFELTTDASNFAVGAVLSQNNRPIIFISRTLNQTEQNYATNEKEALAIVWALQQTRNYIYGIANLTIYTDHQPLTFAMSEKNPNLKIKRWKNIIEESGAKILYKPGKQNVVADALSRQFCNALDTDSESDSGTSIDTVHSRESSLEQDIRRTLESINVFRTQIELRRSHRDLTEHETIFPNYIHYSIEYTNADSVITQLKHVVNNKNINALSLRPEDEPEIIPKIKQNFPNIKFLITSNVSRDITDPEEQIFLMTQEHNRAHRCAKENYLQMRQKYFWPDLKRNLEAFVKKCEICTKNKYERHPTLEPIGVTPIPKNVGEMLHLDIFFLENHKFLTCIDKFSKFLQIYHLRTNAEVPKLIEQVLIVYPYCINITTDNDAMFTSHLVNSIFTSYNIVHHTTPISHSVTNGQVERVHSTILELARSLAEQQNESVIDVVYLAAREYNKTIHSVTKQKPVDIFYHSDRYPEVADLIKKAQEKELEVHNRKRFHKTFTPGDKIFVKTDRRSKAVPRYKEYIVQTDNRETITTTTNKLIHKDNIRNPK